jgi:hypothetical protein
MWFLAGLFTGVVLGFFLAGLCNIAAITDERYFKRCDSLEVGIKDVA